MVSSSSGSRHPNSNRTGGTNGYTNGNGEQLNEQLIQDSFHSYLKSSLTQAKAERLLDADVLSSAEGDLMITGPALCLYFAALRSTTNPPSVPLPRTSKSTPPLELSQHNCPPTFISFLHVWSLAVPKIQSLLPEFQHDLARIICGLPPLQEGGPREIMGIAADLRAVAIEISQRRSFQDRYRDDLQAALDAGAGATLGSRTASFAPPPTYEDTVSVSSNSPRASLDLSEPKSASSPRKEMPLPPVPVPHNLPTPPPSASLHRPPPPILPTTSRPTLKGSPTLLSPNTPAFEFIRESLYASLLDLFSPSSPNPLSTSLRSLLRTDPPRAYFASVAFAMLDMAEHNVLPDGSVRGVLGRVLSLEECPVHYRPFMIELANIGKETKEIEEEDTQLAIELIQRGEDVPEARMDRVRKILEEGVGYDLGPRARSPHSGPPESSEARQIQRTRSVEGRAVMFANRINALSLGLTRLRAFRARQDEVFKVLSGV